MSDAQVLEDAPEFARDLPEGEWRGERDLGRIAQRLIESAKAVRDAVESKVAAGQDMKVHYDHPILVLQHLVWHEGRMDEQDAMGPTCGAAAAELTKEPLSGYAPRMDSRRHWETIYGKQDARDVSWYRPHLDRSLHFIDQAGLSPDAAIIDVGGGASTLVDDLLARGYRNVTVLDLSEGAIAQAKTRLGSRGESVNWIVGDITLVSLPEHRFDFWHDRAVFHFLTDDAARQRYVAAVRHALKPGGHVVVATFGPDGPERCSGLPVVRYSAEGIHAQFGQQFTTVGSDAETHHTPWGSEQEFVYCYCRMATE